MYLFYYLSNKGYNICYIGTHKILYKNKVIETNNTTLEIDKLINILKENDIYPKYIVMEVSSHGIVYGRINCFNFHIIALTNLGSDHLDFHKNIENYHNVKINFISYSLAKFKIVPNIYKNKFNNKRNIIFYKEMNIKEKFNTISFNKDNMFLAYLILRKMKFQKLEIINNLNTIKLDNGRYQIIKHNNRNIVIDYAHHIESFKAILDNGNFNKVVVFGCGGNRDNSKRKIMGEIASSYCKYVIITKDNSRNESLDNIINDITSNISSYIIIKDRAKAIQYALTNYSNLDVYILGKGDEKYIIENNNFVPFNDFNCVNEIINSLK